MEINIKLNYSDLEKSFDETIIKRGEDILKNNLIKFIKFDKDFNLIKAKVSNTYNDKYTVRIVISESSKEIIHKSCTCPFNGNCKHLAAVLLYLLKNKSEKGTENPLKKIGDYEEKEAYFDLKEFDSESTPPKIKDTLENFDFPVNTESSIRYKLVFIVKKNEMDMIFAPFEDKEELQWEIKPIIQKIRADGTFGVIEELNTGKITEKPTREEVFLLKRMGIILKKAPFHSVIEYVSKFQNRITLYLALSFPDVFYKATIYTIEQIDIKFIPKEINIKDRTLNFKSEIIYKDKEGVEYNKDKIISIELIDDKLIVYTIFGVILYLRHEEIVNFFIDLNITKEISLSYKDIEYLKNYIIKKEFYPKINLIFDYKQMIIKKELPQPILEFIDLGIGPEHQYNGINIYFQYLEKHLFPFSEKSTYSIINEKEQENLILIERNLKLEEEIINFVLAKLDDSMILEEKKEPELFNFLNATLSKKEKSQYLIPLKFEEFIARYGEDLIEENIEIRYKNKKTRPRRGTINILLTSDIDWFNLRVQFVDYTGERYNFNLTDYMKKKILEINNDYLIISKKDREILDKILEDGIISHNEIKISKYNFDFIDQCYEKIENKSEEDFEKFRKIANQLKDFNKIEQIDIPANFNGELREYQKQGLYWLYFLYKYNLNGCLADDMGLGKTAQTLALLLKVKEENPNLKILLVVPVTTITNWENEIKKFAPSLKFIRYIGSNRIKDLNELLKYDCIITSYHTLRNDIKLFKDFEFDYCILDEAQNIKNPDSLLFRTVKLIKSKHRLSLTGTPVENNTRELWAQMDFLNPGLLGKLSDFLKNYYFEIEKVKSKEKIEKLRKKIFPFILRRKKEDVLKDLPPKEEIIYYCEMPSAQRKAYTDLREYLKKEVFTELAQEGLEKSIITIIDAILRLRQMALFPSLVDSKFDKVGSVKYEELKNMIEEIVSENHKILIFSQFVKILKIIEEYIKEKNYKYCYLDGSTKRRDLVIKRFQEDKDTKIFLLSLKAGGVGINLTEADYVIIFDPWWNPAVEKQAIDRAHRIGQTKNVFAYKIIVKDTVEEKILELQEKKKALVSELITEDTNFYKSLTTDDIMHLFS